MFPRSAASNQRYFLFGGYQKSCEPNSQLGDCYLLPLWNKPSREEVEEWRCLSVIHPHPREPCHSDGPCQSVCSGFVSRAAAIGLAPGLAVLLHEALCRTCDERASHTLMSSSSRFCIIGRIIAVNRNEYRLCLRAPTHQSGRVLVRVKRPTFSRGPSIEEKSSRFANGGLY